MQALVGDEMRESPYLVLRVPPMAAHGGLLLRKQNLPRVAGCTQAVHWFVL